jgi:hypothetical protein
VIAGLDPAIHHLREAFFKIDGCPDQIGPDRGWVVAAFGADVDRYQKSSGREVLHGQPETAHAWSIE